MPQARIKHIAMMAADTHKVAAFYKEAFGMREVMRRDRPNGPLIVERRTDCDFATATRSVLAEKRSNVDADQDHQQAGSGQ